MDAIAYVYRLDTLHIVGRYTGDDIADCLAAAVHDYGHRPQYRVTSSPVGLFDPETRQWAR